MIEVFLRLFLIDKMYARNDITLKYVFYRFIECNPSHLCIRDAANLTNVDAKFLGEYDEVSFSNSRIERIAATHQYGLRERLGKRGQVVKYPQRGLLCITTIDINRIGSELINNLSY